MTHAAAAGRTERPWREALVMALVCYVPLATGRAGVLNADTKQYLYLDPGGLLERAANVWDPTIAGGTVTHQNIGYLWPMGPYFWLAERLGTPDWLASRVWIGSILFAASLGALVLIRHLLVRHPVQVVAALAYGLSPVVLGHVTGQSALLLPFAALPWLVWAMRRALDEGGWRWPAVIALLVATAGSLNGSSVFFVIVGAGLLVPYAVWCERSVTWRAAAAATGRTIVLTAGAQLWWIAAYVAGGAVGLPLLATTETVGTTSLTTSAAEITRGLGYWFFYGGDSSRPWLDGLAPPYLESPVLITITFLVPIVALVAAASTRWAGRGYAVVLALTGLVIATLAFAEPSRSPLGAAFESASRSSDLVLSLRNTQRAAPLLILGLALCLAAALTALTRRHVARAWGAAALVGLLVAGAVPALWRTGYVADRFSRPEELPEHWLAAAEHLSEGDGRILEIPGIDFAAYRWGNTLDPVTPGLVDRSYVGRELVPMGSRASVALLAALDRSIQEGWLEPGVIAPVARLFGASDLVVRSDLEYERYRTVRPERMWQWVTRAPGLGDPATFGDDVPNVADASRPMIDEIELALGADAPQPPAVAVFPVEGGGRDHLIAWPAGSATVLAGDGEGIVAAAAAGLLGSGPLLLSADLSRTPDAVRAGLGGETRFIVTDTNRKRGERWYSLRENVGATESANGTIADDTAGVAAVPIVPDQRPDAQTTAEVAGVDLVRASHYGSPFNLIPEERPALVLDGDLRTAWRVDTDTFSGPFWVRVDLDEPSSADHVVLHAPIGRPGTRSIERGEVVLDGDRRFPFRLVEGEVRVDLDGATFERLEVRLLDVGPDDGPAGLAEIEIPGIATTEVVVLPTDVFDLVGGDLADSALAVVLSRHRADAAEPVRADPEPAMRRRLEVPEPVELQLDGTARLSPRADDTTIDALLGVPVAGAGWVRATSSEHLPGDVMSRASAALDGDPSTAWTTPLVGVTGQWWEVELAQPTTLSELQIELVADDHHSLPTRLDVVVDGGEPTSVAVPPVERGELGTTRSVAVPLPSELTGTTLRVGVSEIDPRSAPDWYTGDPSVLPVAFAEVSLPGVTPAPPPTTIDTGCRDDLVTVDGAPLPVRVSGRSADASAGRGLDLERCSAVALDLAAGSHDVSTAWGRDVGIDVDRLVLRTPRWSSSDASADDVTPIPVELTERGTTRAAGTVESDGEPFWLVLDQSHNEGWELSIDGARVDGPHVVDGTANTWLVEPESPGTLAVSVTWTPQRTVWIAIVLSLLTAAACLVLIVLGARRSAPVRPRQVPELALRPAGGARWGVIAASTLIVGLTVHPLLAPVPLLIGATWRWLSRVPGIVLLPAVALSVGGALVTIRQIVDPEEFDSGWAGQFPYAHLLAAIAIHLLVLLVHLDPGQNPSGDATPGESAT